MTSVHTIWPITLVPLSIGFLLGLFFLRMAAPLPAQLKPDTRIRYEHNFRLVFGSLALVMFLLLSAWLLPQVSRILILLFVAIIVATAIRPTAEKISGWRIPVAGIRLPIELSVLIIYFGLVIVLILIGLFIAPRILSEAQELTTSFPQYGAFVTGLLERLTDFPFVPPPREVRQTLQEQITSNLSFALSVLNFMFGLIGGILSSLLVAVLALFSIRDAERIIDHFVGLLPAGYRQQTEDVLGKAGQKIQGWVMGTLLLALVVGSATTVGLILIGMPFPFLLGLIAAFGELIPMIGPYLAAAPALLIALTQSLQLLLLVTALYLIIQQVENNFLGPVIVGRQVELPALLVLIALITGAALMGILGALLAVPFVAILQVIWLKVIVPWLKGIER